MLRPVWSNLLSGVVGAVIGMVGAVAAAVLTINKEARHAVRLAEDQRAHDAAGRIGVCVVALFDALTDLTRHETEPSEAELAVLRRLVDDLRRSIVLDGPVVSVDLEGELKAARKAVSEGIPPRSEAPTKEQLRGFLQQVDDVGESIKKYRRSSQRSDAAN